MAFQQGGEIEEQASFQQGGDLPDQFQVVSRPLTFEEQAENARQQQVVAREEFAGRVQADFDKGSFGVASDFRFTDVNRRLSQRDPIDLLAGLSQFDPIKDRGKRKIITNQLKKMGIPEDSIFDFIRQTESPEGLRGFLQQEAIPLAGEIAGGAIGARFGGIKGGAAGSTIGRGVGEAGQAAFESKFFPERRGTAKEEFNDAVFDTGLAGLTDLASAGTFGLLKQVLRGGGRQLRPGASQFAEGLGKTDIAPDILERITAIQGGVQDVPATLLASQRTANPLINSIENIVGKSLVGQNKFQAVRLKTIGAFQTLAQRNLDDVVKGFTELDLNSMAVVVDDAVRGSKDAFSSVWRNIYGQVDEAVAQVVKGGDAVDVRAAKKTASDITQLVQEGRRLGQVSEEGKSFVGLVSQLRDDMSFVDAQINRSDLLSLAQQFERRGDNRAAGLARKMAGQIKTAQEVAAKAAGGDTLKLWKSANATFAEGQKLWDSKVINGLAREIADSPGAVTSTIFKQGRDGVTSVKKVKDILLGTAGKTAGQIADNKNTWEILQKSYLEDLISKGSDVDGFLIGQNFAKVLQQSDAVLKETFSASQLKSIRKIADQGRVVQQRLQGEGGLLVRLLEAPALVGIATGKGAPQAIASLVSAAGLADMMTNPKKAKLLAEGLIDVGKGSRAAERGSAILVRELIRSSTKTKKERSVRSNQRQQGVDERKQRERRKETIRNLKLESL